MQVHCTTRKVEIYDNIKGIVAGFVADGKADTPTLKRGKSN